MKSRLIGVIGGTMAMGAALAGMVNQPEPSPEMRSRALSPRGANGKPYISRRIARGLSTFFNRLRTLRSDRNLTQQDIDRIGAAKAKRDRKAAKVLRDGGIAAYNGPTPRAAIDEVLNRGW